ncbi:type II toxin-antitoxin system VapC family toxin [Deinococcus marmoris]|uniref:type II toxin-antitoxin system VapC family toxin n=1 Tax=Deinococcus marmoris TaxID=249408 RepID=UPI000B1B94EC|nr:type II toxin-antitoxin system VapC family toxin [Deinococcus marmoris]
MTRPALYLLDTNTCIYTMNRRPELVGVRVEEATEAGHEIGISSITLHELWFGIYRSDRIPANTRTLQELIATLNVYTFDDVAANMAAGLRADLKKTGRPIGPYDGLIAGHTLSLNAVLVTNNTGEFSRVAGLKYEDWTK